MCNLKTWPHRYRSVVARGRGWEWAKWVKGDKSYKVPIIE